MCSVFYLLSLCFSPHSHIGDFRVTDREQGKVGRRKEGEYHVYQEAVLYQGKPEAEQQTFRHNTATILSA